MALSTKCLLCKSKDRWISALARQPDQLVQQVTHQNETKSIQGRHHCDLWHPHTNAHFPTHQSAFICTHIPQHAHTRMHTNTHKLDD